MILTEAKKRARREFEQVLERTGLSMAELHTEVEADPRLKSATWRVPRYGVAGMQAGGARRSRSHWYCAKAVPASLVGGAAGAAFALPGTASAATAPASPANGGAADLAAVTTGAPAL